MATNTPHINCRERRRRTVFVLLLVACATGSFLAAPAAMPDSPPTSAPYSYGWPVKPFDKPHPVRGSFGDPRTAFHAAPTTRGALKGHGTFGFHQGVDISAPNGASVYPVVNGVVERVRNQWIRVDSGDGLKFEYWHIRAAVSEGDRVIARRTVLGRILKPAAHVHLTEYRAGHVVNPLLPGNLGPYRDTTQPSVSQLQFRRSETGGELIPGFVRGRVHLLAEAYDLPSLPAPGTWEGLPVSPALITWRIKRWTGKVVVPTQIAYDVRNGVPDNTDFWRHYARGTYQNMAVFGRHYSFLQQGRFLFKLTPGPFDTRQLHDGVYDLVVTATDTGGNHGTLSQRFTVHNRPGWSGS
jgi:murein DD-endopeptidase MepM/ murein hydrolase activator NlpD